MTDDTLHLGMCRISSKQNPLVLLCAVGHNLVDLGNEGTGRIDDLCLTLCQFFVHLAGNAVGTDHHRLARKHLIGGIDRTYAEGFQLLHHLGIVDDRTEGADLAALPNRLKHHVHRPADAEAETGAFGNRYHKNIPFASRMIPAHHSIIADIFINSSGKTPRKRY